MTLIPLISAIIAEPQATIASAGQAMPIPMSRNSYGASGGHRPVAALLALGLPAAMIVAVALSPMIVEIAPISEPIPTKFIELTKPVDPVPPEAEAKVDPAPRSNSASEAVDPVFDRPELADDAITPGPSIPDPMPDPGPATRPADPPPLPKLVLAELDTRYLAAFQPDYPASEQRREVEGVARVRVLIGTDGRVKAVELVSTDSPGFFAETKRRALAKWRFIPAMRGGVVEESWKEMVVRFKIAAA